MSVRNEVTLSIPATIYPNFEEFGVHVMLVNYDSFSGSSFEENRVLEDHMVRLILKYLVNTSNRLHPVHLAFVARWRGGFEYHAGKFGMTRETFLEWTRNPEDVLSVLTEIYIRNNILREYEMPFIADLPDGAPRGTDPVPVIYIEASGNKEKYRDTWSIFPFPIFRNAKIGSKAK